MKLLKLAIVMVSFLFSFSLYAEDRGGHCQPPSCLGLRVGSLCGGALKCGIGFIKAEFADGRVLCIREGSDAKTIKCKDGKEVLEQTAEGYEAEQDAG